MLLGLGFRFESLVVALQGEDKCPSAQSASKQAGPAEVETTSRFVMKPTSSVPYRAM